MLIICYLVFVLNHLNLSLSDIEGESWRDVQKHENFYLISSHGRIKSIGRFTLHNYGGERWIKERINGQHLSFSGYPRVTLCVGQIRTYHFVHVLVCSAFNGPREASMTVNHKDGVKANNHYSNLEWVTQSENSKHAYMNGLIKKRFGKDNHFTILEESQVLIIKKLLSDKSMPINQIAKKFGVSRGAIYGIKKGYNWKNVC